MTNNANILISLIDEDYGIKNKEGSRWPKGIEHDSIVVDRDKGIFYYNSAGIVGDPLVYLTQVRKMSFNSAKEFLKSFNYEGTYVYTFSSGKEDVVVYPKLVDIFFDNGKDKREYFYNRGLTDDTIDRFRLGWYNSYNTVPFFMDGTFRNFQLRMDTPRRDMRSYYNGVGPLMFNSDILSVVKKVYFTEGPVDAMILMQNGLPAISTNMSGNVLPKWYSYFVNIEEIYLVMDNDSAGIHEATRVAKMLGTTRCKIYTFADMDKKGYDPVDFFRDGRTVEEFIDLVENNSKYSFELEEKNKRSKVYGNTKSKKTL